ncbi:MAG: sigma-70 family RNA polymerase sigma factor [Candidatus Eremiobacteraeota bacterium]|nr:sigma-70 family RNA polymerase sigma factor [Candidatus Eremiobacteraeota bacterium]
MALQFRAMPLRRLGRERLVTEYAYLCRRAARRFMRRGLDPADLEQVGAIGLIKAVDRYDPTQPAPFEAYAWLLIVGELMHYVRDSERALRAPRRVRALERQWAAAEQELWALLGREPSEEAVRRYAKVTPDQARDVQAYRASNRVLSVERSGRCVAPPLFGGIDDLLDRLTVEGMLSALPPLERQIVVSIHVCGSTVIELAARLGYSRRHVTRLHRAAMERLRNSCEVGAEGHAEAGRDVSLSHRR